MIKRKKTNGLIILMILLSVFSGCLNTPSDSMDSNFSNNQSKESTNKNMINNELDEPSDQTTNETMSENGISKKVAVWPISNKSLIEEVPPNATIINATDERIRDIEALQEALEEATNRTELGRGVKNDSEVLQSLEKLPKYESDSRKYTSGYYIQYENQVVYVGIIKEK